MKTLYVDLETSPNLADVWSLWNNNVSLSQLRKSGRVLCFAAKWAGGRKVQFWSEPEHGRDGMLLAAHKLLDTADVVVHYNGEKFDIPWFNAEFAVLGMKPPAPFQQLDLMRVVKQRFRFPSNKLEYIAKVLELSGKAQNSGHMLWVECELGKAKAWREMKRYNKQDVVVTEELHQTLLPWITSGPNRRLYDSPDGCPNCGSEDLRKEGFAYTGVSKFQRYSCKGCGGWFRSGKRIDGTDLRGVAA